ncbi:cytidine/deoxycytidylate deaminase family protein [Candidatus Latescibacterota bacterium]
MSEREVGGGRPGRNEYYMRIAMAVRARADCLGNRVGAIVVLEDRIISTGYNGTPANMPNCTEGGCKRCSDRDRYSSGKAYDLCICVHAEQNAILSAARFGIATDGALMYSTMRPCFGCTKELLQARIRGVYYLHEWEYPESEMQDSYLALQSHFPDGVQRIAIPDPEEEWAVSRRRSST